MSESDARAEAPRHGDLPLPDYDHLPLSSLQHRVRTLDEQGVSALLGYESEHGRRLPVLEVLEQRLHELREGAEPSGGSPQADQPEAAPAPTGRSSASPQTEGPAVNPPSQGVPTNPAQPRSTG